MSLNDADIRQQITQLEQDWMDAWKRRDAAALDGFLAEEFTLTSALSTGDLIDKTQWIDLALRAYECESFGFPRILVRAYGDVAVVNALYRQKATANGQDWSGDFLITDVWVKRGGRWQVVTRHSSRPNPTPDG